MQAESCYALVRELWRTPPNSLRNGKMGLPDDIAINNDGEYYKILVTSLSEHELITKLSENELITRRLLDSFAIQVQKVLDAKEGDIQWKVLN